ncbi:MAG: hypothetical protein KJ811_01975, partial [Candidatus Margulisbacteria bacterium]|nr:hypothetical protein [Candidatus Margulisiibacteriota bacterium]
MPRVCSKREQRKKLLQLNMKDLGARIDFHTHTIFSDGQLLPAALAYEAHFRGHIAIAITDHV